MERKLLICALVIVGVSIGIATAVNGYGLVIVSWPWLIGGSFGSVVVAGLIGWLGEE